MAQGIATDTRSLFPLTHKWRKLMNKHYTALMKEWKGYCQQFPEFDYDQPTDVQVNSVVSELEGPWFRPSTVEDLDLNYMAADDLAAGEWVWLGNEEHVVTLGCADNWILQSGLEKNVCNYTFTDIAAQFVLEAVADQLRVHNADES